MLYYIEYLFRTTIKIYKLFLGADCRTRECARARANKKGRDAVEMEVNGIWREQTISIRQTVTWAQKKTTIILGRENKMDGEYHTLIFFLFFYSKIKHVHTRPNVIRTYRSRGIETLQIDLINYRVRFSFRNFKNILYYYYNISTTWPLWRDRCTIAFTFSNNYIITYYFISFFKRSIIYFRQCPYFNYSKCYILLLNMIYMPCEIRKIYGT